MRYTLDLEDGGPLVECRDANQAAVLGSLWRTTKLKRDVDYEVLIAERIRAIAAAARATPAPRSEHG